MAKCNLFDNHILLSTVQWLKVLLQRMNIMITLGSERNYGQFYKISFGIL